MVTNASQSAAKTLTPDEKHLSQHLRLVPGSIDDGRTLAVTDGISDSPTNPPTTLQLQLCGVAIPEADQPLATQARDHLRDLVSVGNGTVIVVPIKKNNNGQSLADVFVARSKDGDADSAADEEEEEEEIHLNSQMILDGMASVDAQEAGQCPQSDVLERAEEMAGGESVRGE